MRTEDFVKTRMISDLEWCLEQLKYREDALDEEIYEYLYRYIYDTVTKMEKLNAKDGIAYYLIRMENENIRSLLLRSNIELK